MTVHSRRNCLEVREIDRQARGDAKYASSKASDLVKT